MTASPFDPAEPRHTLLCVLCHAILGIANSDEDYEANATVHIAAGCGD